MHLHRLANKNSAVASAKSLNNWVQEGNEEARLKFVFALGDPGDVTLPLEDEPEKSCETLAEDMAYEVVGALVTYSAGIEREGKNGMYGFYPYGKDRATSTTEFKKLPDAWFACTLATMFPYVVRTQDKWPAMLKKSAHPVTGLWPWVTLKRYIGFRQQFTKNRKSLFEAYEKKGGKYHGPEQSAACIARNVRKVPTTKEQLEAMSDSDTDSVDAFSF